MGACCVTTCENSNMNHGGKKSFFKLPTEPRLRRLWLLKCGRAGDPNVKSARVCSDHFAEDDFTLTCRLKQRFQICRRSTLNDDAVPSINLPKIKSFRTLEDEHESDLYSTDDEADRLEPTSSGRHRRIPKRWMDEQNSGRSAKKSRLDGAAESHEHAIDPSRVFRKFSIVIEPVGDDEIPAGHSFTGDDVAEAADGSGPQRQDGAAAAEVVNNFRVIVKKTGQRAVSSCDAPKAVDSDGGIDIYQDSGQW